MYSRTILLVLAAFVGFFGQALCPSRGTVLDRQKDLESFNYVWRSVKQHHFDAALGGLDWDAVRAELSPKVEAAETREEVRRILTSMVGRLGVSHYAIIPAEELDARQASDARPELRQNAETGMEARLIEGKVVVTRVRPDSPAKKAGIRPGWEIVRIGSLRMNRVVDLITASRQNRADRGAAIASAVEDRLRGVAGSSREVEFEKPGGDRLTLEFLLEEPKGTWRARVGHVADIQVRLEWSRTRDGAGVIAIGLFLDPLRLMPAFESALGKLRDAAGIVIDLRGNSGGILPAVTGVASWFFGKPAEFGTVKLREGSVNVSVYPRAHPYDGRVAVLVDETTACGAEVFAAGLRESGRARVFGSRTAGIALAGSIERLPNGDGFMHAVADYVTRGGHRIEGNGIEPDATVVLTRADLSTGRDPVLERALEWIRAEEPGGE